MKVRNESMNDKHQQDQEEAHGFEGEWNLELAYELLMCLKEFG